MRKFCLISFDSGSNSNQYLATLWRGEPSPTTRFESLSSDLHRQSDIDFTGIGHLSNNGAIRRISDNIGCSTIGIDVGTID